MQRETHGPRGDYRVAARPEDPRFTVITVRPEEYARPEWLEELGELWRRLTGRT